MAGGDEARKIAERFADEIGVEDEDVLYAGRQLACVFIEKRGLLTEFSEFADEDAEICRSQQELACEAGPEEPNVEFLRERVAKLEQWLANAKKDLARCESREGSAS